LATFSVADNLSHMTSLDHCPACGRLIPQLVMVSVGFSQFAEDEITVLTDDEDGCRRGPYFCTARHAGHWHLLDEGETWRKIAPKAREADPK
jgi:hypothetical protein